MNIKNFAISFLLLLNAMTLYNTQLIVDSNELKALGEIFKDEQEIDNQGFQQILVEIFPKAFKNYDQEMLQEIAGDFVAYVDLKIFKGDIIQQYLQEEAFQKYTEQWITNMQEQLIQQYANGTSIDEDFSQEMIRNPNFYGLNYASYQIISFNKPEFKTAFKFNLKDN